MTEVIGFINKLMAVEKLPINLVFLVPLLFQMIFQSEKKKRSKLLLEIVKDLSTVKTVHTSVKAEMEAEYAMEIIQETKGLYLRPKKIVELLNTGIYEDFTNREIKMAKNDIVFVGNTITVKVPIYKIIGAFFFAVVAGLLLLIGIYIVVTLPSGAPIEVLIKRIVGGLLFLSLSVFYAGIFVLPVVNALRIKKWFKKKNEQTN